MRSPLRRLQGWLNQLCVHHGRTSSLACCGKHWCGRAPSVVGGVRSLPSMTMNSFACLIAWLLPPVSMLFSGVFLARSSESYKSGSMATCLWLIYKLGREREREMIRPNHYTSLLIDRLAVVRQGRDVPCRGRVK
jgi:hypothetical protein